VIKYRPEGPATDRRADRQRQSDRFGRENCKRRRDHSIGRSPRALSHRSRFSSPSKHCGRSKHRSSRSFDRLVNVVVRGGCDPSITDEKASKVGPAAIDIVYQRLGNHEAPLLLLIMGVGVTMIRPSDLGWTPYRLRRPSRGRRRYRVIMGERCRRGVAHACARRRKVGRLGAIQRDHEDRTP
jgi:hypothetical protein